jgi:ADP-ribose pyrophosphatase YjhB (NUDIX family)
MVAAEGALITRAPGMTKLGLLEELRGIAQLGLVYAADPFDRRRYERLLELACREYADLSDLPAGEIMDRFRAELGYITPKVGVDAAVFDDRGRLLLTRRADDGLWCLPCGWAELAETAQESLRREVLEETGLEVQVRSLIEVFCRRPGDMGPHTSYHILYHCVPVGGGLAVSDESLEVGFHDHTAVTEWHQDHRERAERAHRFWREHLELGQGTEDPR